MIVNAQRSIPVATKPLSQFFERARRKLRFPESAVTVRLISDSAMARLNRDFRGKRGPTDVLSFPAEAGKGVEDGGYVGDIAIAPQTARRNARLWSRTLAAELRILVLHGMIHLAGYDHEADNGEMNRFERRLRRELDLEQPGAGKANARGKRKGVQR